MYSNKRIDRALVFFRNLLPSIFFVVLSLVTLYPIIFIIFAAFEEFNELRMNPIGLPAHLLWSNFSSAWTKGGFSNYYINSIIIVIPVVILVIFCSVLASYALIRIRFPGRRFFLVLIVAGLTLPQEATIIPLYYQMLNLHLLNNPLSVIFPTIGIIIPFGVLLLTGFIATIPSDLLDAAKVDGANDWQALLYVIFPIAQPGVIALLVFTFLWTWNQFFLPTVMLPNPTARTLPAGLSQFLGAYLSENQLLAAGTLITCAPVIILYIFFQRQFIQGITAGAMKG